MGIESTHDNHLVLKNRQLRSLAMIIIACLKQESKFVDKEDFFSLESWLVFLVEIF